MAGVVHIPWYATGFRHDKLAAALAGIAPVALRYGARSYQVHRYRDDLYKFLQTAEFESKLDFERYWNGPEFIDFRVLASSWYQVPVLYGWSRPRRRGHARARRRRSQVASGVAGGRAGGVSARSGDPRLALGRALDVHPHAGQRLADEA